MAAISTSTYGSGQLVSLAMTGAVNLRASHTIAVRVKNSSTSTTSDTIACAYSATSVTFNPQGSAFGRNNGVTSTAYNVYRINDSFSPTADAAARSTCYGNTTTWYHCCLVYNASTQQIRYYIDGVFIGQHASNTTRTGSVTSTTFGVGSHPGKFADAAMYDRALSDSEVADLADYRVPQVTSGLYLFWRLDANANDSSGNGRNGGVTGSGSSITWSTSDNPPQPENPPVAITGSASASTSGTANVSRVAALGACTSSTSTSGTAAVSIAYRATASGRGYAFADVMPRNGAEGWRFPPAGVINDASANGVATGGAVARTVMCWLRQYDAGLPSGVDRGRCGFYVRGTGGSNWYLVIQANYFSGQMQFQGIAGAGGSDLGSRQTPTVDGAWHHLCVTYDGSVVKFYLDAVQVGTDLTASIPADDTATSAVVIGGGSGILAQNAADAAHAKFWVGAALDATQIAAEMATYRPVTSTANLRAYWPMAWDNPRWDAWSNTYTLPAAMVHSSDDAPNGPSGSWPPIGSVAGSTSTSGTAQLNRVYALGACTSSTSTSGTAAISPSYAVTASSSTQTSGAAQLNRLFLVPATGATSTAGSAAATISVPLAATASTATPGTASVSISYALAPAASAQATGSATVDIAYGVAAAGSSSTAGTAAISASAAIAATGATSTAGAASTPITFSVSATGGGQTTGTVALSAAAGLAATGATSTTGAAGTAGTLPAAGEAATSGAAFFDAAQFPVVSAGESATSGTAAVDAGLPFTASGEAATSGTATLSASAALVASGSATTSGAGMFALRLSANTQTTGAVVIDFAAALAAASSSATSGTAALGRAIFPTGQTTTSGAAALAAVVSISAAASNVTSGSAVFDGVAPVGGGGGQELSSRRMLGALGVRRAIR